MSIFRTLQRPPEARDTTGFLTFRDVFAPLTHAGKRVDQTTALTLPVVYRCIALNVETISSLPLGVYQKRGNKRVEYPRPYWMKEPNDEQTWDEFLSQMLFSMEVDGNAFALKAVTSKGALAGLYVLDPTSVIVERVDGRIVYHVDTETDGRKTFASTEMLHIKGLVPPGSLRGLSPIACAKQAIGLGLAVEQFAGMFFGEGAHMSGLIEVPGNLNATTAEALQESFKKKHGGVSKSHAIGVLSGGAKWVPMSVKPEESQFLETQRYNAVQVACLMGAPPEWVTETEGAKGYVTSLASKKLVWWQTGLLPRCVRFERAFSALLPRPAYVKFNVKGLLRGDPQEESAQLSTMWDRGILSADEWRALMDMDPKPDGETYYIPMNWAPEGVTNA